MILKNSLLFLSLLCFLYIIETTTIADENIKEIENDAKIGTKEEDIKREIDDINEIQERQRRWFYGLGYGWGLGYGMGYGWGYPYYGYYGKRDADKVDSIKENITENPVNEKDHEKHDMSKRSIETNADKTEIDDDVNDRHRRWFYGLGYGWGLGYGMGYGWGYPYYGYYGKRDADKVDSIKENITENPVNEKDHEKHDMSKRSVETNADKTEIDDDVNDRHRRWFYGLGYGWGYPYYGYGWGYPYYGFYGKRSAQVNKVVVRPKHKRSVSDGFDEEMDMSMKVDRERRWRGGYGGYRYGGYGGYRGYGGYGGYRGYGGYGGYRGGWGYGR